MTESSEIDYYIELRAFLEQRLLSQTERWRLINQFELIDQEGNIDEERLAELFEEENLNVPIVKYESKEAFLHDLNSIIESLKQRNIDKGEDFEFFRPIRDEDLIPERTNTADGIRMIHLRYHTNQPVYATDDLPESGFETAKVIQKIINTQYPQYAQYLKQYCRPLGTTDATFKDFNKAQYVSDEVPEDRKERVLRLLKKFLNVKKYKPVHYTSTAYARTPLSTGTGYYDRSHYRTRALAQLTHSKAYLHKPTSKGYFYNATFEEHRRIIHNIKHYRCPYKIDMDDEEAVDHIITMFYAQRSTMLYTRNHISELLKALKVRPVYNVDVLFLKCEIMLTLALLAQMRPIESCIMYSLETIRGGCHYLDKIAQQYNSYFTIDWSSFDQTLPRVITSIYYTDFLESLIIINKGYTSAIDYNGDKPLDTHGFFTKISNLLSYLHEWYESMVFTTADGYSYQRTSAGVPSGLFNTQMLDSFANLFIIIEALIEYGFTDEEILDVRLFIMGDDNTGFTNIPIQKLEKFIQWFELYAQHRWHMILSRAKSIITELRQKIEVLGYIINFGTPKKNIGKLVAQLCYPERGLKLKYMSYRALGIAYAAAGQCPTFHAFCRDVYMAFLEHQPELTKDIKDKMKKYLPGIFMSTDDYFQHLDFTKFPSIYEVQQMYSRWQGSLGYEPKWDRSYFTEPPLCEDEDAITILEYRKLQNIPRTPIKHRNINTHL